MKSTKKEELINKLGELTALLGITGSLSEDGQSLFIAHSTLTVLTAAQDESHARLLMRHLDNFISEVQVIQGEKSITDLFSERMVSCKN
jgi:hypothetical protein